MKYLRGITILLCVFCVLGSIGPSIAATPNNDNNVSQDKAISIAKLHYTSIWNNNDDTDFNVTLSKNGQYWIVNQNDDYSDVAVNIKTGESRMGYRGEWSPLNKLQSVYAASTLINVIETYYDIYYDISDPVKTKLDGKDVWKMNITSYDDDNSTTNYIYFDDTNGQVKTTWSDLNKIIGKTGWLTPKEVETAINKFLDNEIPELAPHAFKNELTDFYP